jgi:putative transposase
MWEPERRRAAVRDGLCYPSDLTDAEWALAEPMIPPAKCGGRRREVNVREVLNAIFYVAFDGLPLAGVAEGLAGRRARRIRTSCCGIGMAHWSASIMRSMTPRASTRAGQRARPRRSLTVKAPKRLKRGSTLDPQGFDVAKKVIGRKRHILVDTLGLLLNLVAHSAAV